MSTPTPTPAFDFHNMLPTLDDDPCYIWRAVTDMDTNILTKLKDSLEKVFDALQELEFVLSLTPEDETATLSEIGRLSPKQQESIKATLEMFHLTPKGAEALSRFRELFPNETRYLALVARQRTVTSDDDGSTFFRLMEIIERELASRAPIPQE